MAPRVLNGTPRNPQDRTRRRAPVESWEVGTLLSQGSRGVVLPAEGGYELGGERGDTVAIGHLRVVVGVDGGEHPEQLLLPLGVVELQQQPAEARLADDTLGLGVELAEEAEEVAAPGELISSL